MKSGYEGIVGHYFCRVLYHMHDLVLISSIFDQVDALW